MILHRFHTYTYPHAAASWYGLTMHDNTRLRDFEIGLLAGLNKT
jgi:hypothetical protein